MTAGGTHSTTGASDRSISWPATRRWQGARPYQEDNYGILNFDIAGQAPALLMVLADGMGGAAGGATASRTVVEAFTAHFPHFDGTVDDRLRQCLDAAVASLQEQVTADPALDGMGSTVVAAQYDGLGVSWLSVGDSPMWLFTDGSLERLNADHSMVPVLDQLVESGEMSAEEALRDRRRNMLRSAVTDMTAELIDCADRSCRLRPGDYLLIASDGLETISVEEIGQLLGGADGDAEKAADALISTVRAAAGPAQDNVTILLLSGNADPAGSAASRTNWAPPPIDKPAGRGTAATHGGTSRQWAGVALGLVLGILLFALGLRLLGTPPWLGPDAGRDQPEQSAGEETGPAAKPTGPAAKDAKKQRAKTTPGKKQSEKAGANRQGSDKSGRKEAESQQPKRGDKKTSPDTPVQGQPTQRPDDVEKKEKDRSAPDPSKDAVDGSEADQ